MAPYSTLPRPLYVATGVGTARGRPGRGAGEQGPTAGGNRTDEGGTFAGQ